MRRELTSELQNIGGNRNRLAHRTATAFCVVGLAIAAHSNASDLQDAASHDVQALPGEEIVSQRCVLCHDRTIVSSRRASREEWNEILTRMVNYGAQVTEGDFDSIIEYLTACSASE